MTPRRAAFRGLIVIIAASLAAISGGALAQGSDYDKIRQASTNQPSPPPQAARPVEGVEAAEALNADINARNAEAAARDRAAEEAYARRRRAYEAKKKADAAAYARALAEYEARKAAVERQRQADLAAWQARVAACKAGDQSACAPK